MRYRHILPFETGQIFAQMFAFNEAEKMSAIIQKANTPIPLRHLIVTLRYTDWWWWEQNSPLRLDTQIMPNFQLPLSLEKFTMEFETRQGNQDQLDALIRQNVSKWGKSAEDGKKWAMSPSSPRSRSYIGTDTPGGQAYAHHHKDYNPPPKGMPEPGQDEMYYYAVTVDFVKV